VFPSLPHSGLCTWSLGGNMLAIASFFLPDPIVWWPLAGPSLHVGRGPAGDALPGLHNETTGGALGAPRTLLENYFSTSFIKQFNPIVRAPVGNNSRSLQSPNGETTDKANLLIYYLNIKIPRYENYQTRI
jgi:hypothetical protein